MWHITATECACSVSHCTAAGVLAHNVALPSVMNLQVGLTTLPLLLLQDGSAGGLACCCCCCCCESAVCLAHRASASSLMQSLYMLPQLRAMAGTSYLHTPQVSTKQCSVGLA
jgi:hypothetical protein